MLLCPVLTTWNSQKGNTVLRSLHACMLYARVSFVCLPRARSAALEKVTMREGLAETLEQNCFVCWEQTTQYSWHTVNICCVHANIDTASLASRQPTSLLCETKENRETADKDEEQLRQELFGRRPTAKERNTFTQISQTPPSPHQGESTDTFASGGQNAQREALSCGQKRVATNRASGE